MVSSPIEAIQNIQTASSSISIGAAAGAAAIRRARVSRQPSHSFHLARAGCIDAAILDELFDPVHRFFEIRKRA
jgi:hypothetical protein